MNTNTLSCPECGSSRPTKAWRRMPRQKPKSRQSWRVYRCPGCASPQIVFDVGREWRCLETRRVLNERETKILSLRFGSGGEPACSLAGVGEVIGVTRERVRQLQNIALLKLQKEIVKHERGAS